MSENFKRGVVVSPKFGTRLRKSHMRRCARPFIASWSLYRPRSASHGPPGWWKCSPNAPSDIWWLHFGSLVPLVKFKSCSECQECRNAESTKNTENAQRHHLFSPIFKNLLFLFHFVRKLLDIWPMFSRQHLPFCHFFQFLTMQQFRGQSSLHSTKSTAAQIGKEKVRQLLYMRRYKEEREE